MALPQFPVRKFTVQEYRRMGEAGVLSPGDQVELLEGWVVPKVIHNPPHDLALMLLEDQLRKHLAEDQLMRLQMPITTKDSEPEPDLVIVPGPIRRYATAHPSAKEACLVVEISDTSVERDRQKCRIYAGGGVPEYWLVNLHRRQVEVYADPDDCSSPPQFRSRVNYTETSHLPLSFASDKNATIRVGDILP